ncbi:hypothetical protein INR49_025399, partial [Caranx melampygus]
VGADNVRALYKRTLELDIQSKTLDIEYEHLKIQKLKLEYVAALASLAETTRERKNNAPALCLRADRLSVACVASDWLWVARYSYVGSCELNGAFKCNRTFNTLLM